MDLYTSLTAATDAFTGLIPAAFFTILALMLGAYVLVSRLFISPDAALPPPTFPSPAPFVPPPPPPPEPVQLGEVTPEELRAYDGSDPEKPLLIAIRGQIYDVSRSRLALLWRAANLSGITHFLSRGNHIHLMPNQSVNHCDGYTKALDRWLEFRMFYGPGGPYALFAGHDATRALALMSFDPNDLTSNLEGLDEAELEVLQDWEYKFIEKYVKVGQLVSEKTRNREDCQSNEKMEGTRMKDQQDTDAM